LSTTPRKYLRNVADLDSVKLAYQDVWVPEWDIWVRISELTGEELENWRSGMLRPNRRQGGGNMEVDPKRLRGQTARLVCIASRDPEDGQRIFSDLDAPRLLRKGAGAVERLATVARRLSRLVEDDDELEELGNDSGPTPGDNSSTDSQGTSAVLSMS